MTPFEAGFRKVAMEYGMPDEQASQLYSSFSQQPEVQAGPFKSLMQPSAGSVSSPIRMAHIADMLKQHIAEDFSGERLQAQL